MSLQSCQGPEELGHWELRLHPEGHGEQGLRLVRHVGSGAQPQ